MPSAHVTLAGVGPGWLRPAPAAVAVRGPAPLLGPPCRRYLEQNNISRKDFQHTLLDPKLEHLIHRTRQRPTNNSRFNNLIFWMAAYIKALGWRRKEKHLPQSSSQKLHSSGVLGGRQSRMRKVQIQQRRCGVNLSGAYRFNKARSKGGFQRILQKGRVDIPWPLRTLATMFRETTVTHIEHTDAQLTWSCDNKRGERIQILEFKLNVRRTSGCVRRRAQTCALAWRLARAPPALRCVLNGALLSHPLCAFARRVRRGSSTHSTS